ncbi:DltD C-terminal region [Clostridium cavendishii DSM 21758]|uniref:DltD C-terminal region n=1 Tax=Clostridium cavendishii DSM 21758 TaxID=1121302 RepID=A0A1M6AYZ5_9CLOT|nr:chemotaxis protein [Clostridium cavendishii]SHI41690.1 DltD C-terminal region [Clostridium cavendishii DSM 21758]
MISILVFGTGRSKDFFCSGLKENINILAYVDNDRAKWGEIVDGKIVINPKEIDKYDYDYIVIASQYNEIILNQLIDMGVKEKTIFQFFKFMDCNRNYIKVNLEELVKENLLEYEAIITGISYMFSAINNDTLRVKPIKLAFPSQDLFYDFKLAEYILKNEEYNLKNIKYALIGLSYYSFQYDMSLSSLANRTIMYYEAIGEKHNFNDIKSIYRQLENQKILANELLNKNNNGRFLFSYNPNEVLDLKKNPEELGEKQANLDCKKNFPKTVEENRQILIEYFNLLNKHNIKPIIIVCPALKYYTKHFSKRIEDEFHSIIKEVSKEYDFQYIDYFRSELFNDEDFQDVSHLNPKGAEKFTKILNEVIEW